LVNTNFHYIKFKDNMGTSSNVSISSVDGKAVTDASAVDKSQKKEIGSISDRVAIADALMEKIMYEDECKASEKKNLTSHRKSGDAICLNVLSDLLDVVMQDLELNPPIFKENDLKKLMSVFCPDKLVLLKGELSNSSVKKDIINAIKEGMKSASANPEKISIFKRRSLENVMASTLQSMSGRGRLGYKNATIFGRTERLAEIGKALKITGYVLGGIGLAASILTGAGGCLLIGGGIGIAFCIGGANSELKGKATNDISFKFKLLHAISAATNYLAFIGIVTKFIKSKTNFELPIIGSLIAKVNTFAKTVETVADIGIRLQSLIARAKADFKSDSKVSIGFREIWDIIKSNNLSQISQKMKDTFSLILSQMGDGKLDSYLDEMTAILNLVSKFTNESSAIITGIAMQYNSDDSVKDSNTEIPQEVSAILNSAAAAIGYARIAMDIANVVNDMAKEGETDIKTSMAMVKEIFTYMQKNVDFNEKDVAKMITEAAKKGESESLKILEKLGEKFSENSINRFVTNHVNTNHRELAVYRDTANKLSHCIDEAKKEVESVISNNSTQVQSQDSA
ncbi:MAG: hypothetical protein LBH49_00945, partial [Puniceicoccales bacterium]|nr:hypothetical protein [Puniceicoccales bacterium]